jgi:hypothetical protein
MLVEKNHLKHVCRLLSLAGNVLGLVEQLVGLVRLVQMHHQLRLQIVLDKVDQEMHHSLGHAVLDGLAHDVEVRLYQPL